jgi:hypothetical protein
MRRAIVPLLLVACGSYGAAPTGGGAGGGNCTALVCDDFERDDVESSPQWTKVSAHPYGDLDTISISNLHAASPTRSLLVTLQDGDATRRAFVEKDFDAPLADIKVSLKIFVETWPHDLRFVQFFTDADDEAEARLGTDESTVVLQMNGGEGQRQATMDLPQNDFFDVVIEYHSAAGPPTVVLTVDGRTMESPGTGGGGKVKSVAIGAPRTSSETAAGRYFIDDIRIEGK